MDRQQARRLQELVRMLEAAPELDERQRRALEAGRARLAEAEQTVGEFSSRYRGALQGATLRGADELAGIGAGLVPGGMTREQATEQARQRNLEAQLADPEGYSKGETAGLVFTGGASMAIPSVAARNLPMLRRTLLGGAEGVALGTAPEFLGAEGGLLRRTSQVSPLTAGVAGLAGMIAPGAGEMAGRVVRGIQNIGRGAEGFGAKAVQRAAQGVGRTADTGEDIQAYLRDLGDEAMLADVPGGPRSQAMGLASMQGEGGTILNRALTQRAQGSEGRIGDVFNRLVAEPNAAFLERVALETERSGVLGPAYDAALRFRDPMEVSGAVAEVDRFLENSVGQTATALRSLRDDLAVESGQMSAARLHNIRSELSDTIEEARRAGRGGMVAALKPALNAIDEQLDEVPNYAETRGGYADNRAMERSIDDGRNAFTGGTTTVETPDQLAARWEDMTDAEKNAFRLGAREYVSVLMGTARNAPASAWGTMATGFNKEKMQIIFGADEAQEISRLLRGEQEFSQTRGQVTQGSMTAMREAAREDIADLRQPDTGRRPGPLARLRDTINEAGNAVIDSILYGSSRSTANQELGRILAMRGEERNRMLNVLLLEAQRQKGSTRAQAVTRLITEAIAGGLIPNIGGSE